MPLETYDAVQLAVLGHAGLPADGIAAFEKDTVAGLPPVIVPVTEPEPPNTQVTLVEPTGHWNDTLGRVEIVKPPLKPDVQDAKPATGRPVTTAVASQPVGPVLAHELNDSAVRLPVTLTPAAPPALVVTRVLPEAPQVILGLIVPPDVVSVALVDVPVIVVPDG